MAEIKGGILGKVIGSIGNVTGRVRHGKNYISSKPGSFVPGTDDNAVARRKKFRCAVKFAHAVVGVADLKTIWTGNLTGGLNTFNLVTQTNYNLLENNLPSPANIIMPQPGFPIVASSIELTGAALNVILNAIGNADIFDLNLEKSVKLYSVISLSSLNSGGVENYSFVSLESAKTNFQTTQQIAFSIPLDVYQASVIQKYDVVHIYAAIATLDDKDSPVSFSITLYQ